MTEKRKIRANGLSLKSMDQKFRSTAAETDDRLGAIESTLTDMVEESKIQMADILTAIKSTKAKDIPVSFTNSGVSSEDVYQHKDDNTVEFGVNKETGDVEVIQESLTSIGDPEFEAKAEQMLFDNEILEIVIMDQPAQYPNSTFTVAVNGRNAIVFRGKKIRLPRNYVEVLLRAKTSTYGNMEVIDPMTEVRSVKNPETKSMAHPLQIISDPTPVKGAKWLERVTNDMRA